MSRIGAALASGVAGIGGAALGAASQVGGVVTLFFRTLACLFPPRFDTSELWRNFHKMGVQSVPIVVLTAFFVGGIMVIQSGVFVKRFSATALLGWGAGYSVLREVGPLLIGLMFSGRVGSNNTAELGTMVVTEQIDGLRALAIDPLHFLIAPRVFAMIIMLFFLTIIGDAVAILGAMLFGKLMLGVDFAIFLQSITDNLGMSDVTHGLVKSAVFGLIIAPDLVPFRTHRARWCGRRRARGEQCGRRSGARHCHQRLLFDVFAHLR